MGWFYFWPLLHNCQFKAAPEMPRMTKLAEIYTNHVFYCIKLLVPWYSWLETKSASGISKFLYGFIASEVAWSRLSIMSEIASTDWSVIFPFNVTIKSLYNPFKRQLSSCSNVLCYSYMWSLVETACFEPIDLMNTNEFIISRGHFRATWTLWDHWPTRPQKCNIQFRHLIFQVWCGMRSNRTSRVTA